MADAVKTLQDDVVVSAWDEKTGIITITAEHTDPKLTTAIANAYVESLQRALNTNAFTLAKKNRVFIEAQLLKTRQDLDTAEETRRQFEQTHGIVALDAQAQVAVSAIASLEAQIMAKEVQLGVIQRTLTGSSHEVYLLQEELKELRAQLVRLQRGEHGSAVALEMQGRMSPLLLSLDKAPEIKLQYARLQRETLVQNTLFTLMAQQFEQAKIEEARDETAFQLLDEAIVPEKKAKPPRALMVVLSMIVGSFLGLLVALIREFFDTTIHSREQVEQQTGTIVLASLPPPGQQKKRRWLARPQPPDVPLVAPYALDAPRGEALRYLHTRIQHLNGAHRMQALLLTSPGDKEDTIATLAHLARVVAGVGEKTLLVDSNFRHPGLHGLFQCASVPGLADMLTDPEGWQKGLHTTPVDNLHLVPAGSITPQTPIALESPILDVLLAHFRTAYDLILFAAPPVCSYTDAAVLSAKVDAICLVVTHSVSRIEAITEAKAVLEAVQGKVIGAILTGL
jgi:capsular exopolysaccharide synthesis family protein